MTKDELRTSYVDLGWEVQPVASWGVVSVVEGKTKYDVNVVSPDNKFGTAQIVEDGTGAVAEGFWKEAVVDTFTSRLRTYLDTIEDLATVFAVAVTDTKEADSVATCIAYMEDGSAKNYVVKERADVFTHVELV